MDGIPVKISERYKPPKRITLPGSLQNKFSSELKLEEYDFSLERAVMDEMVKLRELKKASECWRRKGEEEIEALMETTQRLRVGSSSGEQVTRSNPILTPVLIATPTNNNSNYNNNNNNNNNNVKRINLSDFESDTSSPFDNVELKTINDLEELARVLGGSEGGRVGGEASSVPIESYVVQTVAAWREDEASQEILRTLDATLKHHRQQLEEEKAEVEAPALALRVAEMGFPLDRATRAATWFPNDEAKVIEFLLGVQKLEEQHSVPIERAERALMVSECNEEATLRYLENTRQLMALGFPEDQVSSALASSDNDPDKALDYLVS